MNRNGAFRKITLAGVALLGLAGLSTPAWADHWHHGGWGHRGPSVQFYFGSPGYYRPYYYAPVRRYYYDDDVRPSVHVLEGRITDLDRRDNDLRVSDSGRIHYTSRTVITWDGDEVSERRLAEGRHVRVYYYWSDGERIADRIVID